MFKENSGHFITLGYFRDGRKHCLCSPWAYNLLFRNVSEIFVNRKPQGKGEYTKESMHTTTDILLLSFSLTYSADVFQPTEGLSRSNYGLNLAY